LDDKTHITSFEWADYDGCCRGACCNVGPVTDYTLTATGSSFDSFRISVEKNVYDDYENANEYSYIQVPINRIGDFISQHGYITDHSNYGGYNCPPALDFLKTFPPLWVNNPSLSLDEIIALYKEKK
jgi:hypothetical protein